MAHFYDSVFQAIDFLLAGVFFCFLFFELTVCIFTVMKIQIDIQILHRILLECMYTPSGTFCTMFTFFFIL